MEEIKNKEKTEKKIKTITDDFKYKHNILSERFLNPYFDLLDIVLNNTRNFLYEDQKTYVTINETVKFVHDFLKDLDEKYANEFMKSIDNKEIVFCKEIFYGNTKEIKNGTRIMPNMSISESNGSKKIIMPLEDTLEDSLNLLHQYIHFLTYKKGHVNRMDYKKFNNTLPVASEFMFEDKYKNLKGMYSFGTDRLKNLKEDAFETKAKLLLVKQCIKDDKFNINKYVDSFDEENKDLAYRIVNEISNSGNMNFINKYSEIIGLINTFIYINNVDDLSKDMKTFNNDPYNFYKIFDHYYTGCSGEYDRDLITDMNNKFSHKVEDRNIAILQKKINRY